ncbi:CDP-diacylglycerol--serine O-phosphatidyltransferase [Salisaeta longa]|uniref:CDP-diacylglycerol--serine O-phosphatidyltransferase n=1 Tax=Salisaeta longa TaxID=503170 RepID=UPI0003B52327|nr:CDP-diacylglycerol--serine O-phosphatidyltransferase [Salisaeta longa]
MPASDSSSPGARSDPRRIRHRYKAYRSARREQRGERPPPRVAVPSFFTLMNLFSGFLALTQIHEGAYVMAAWLIILAAFFDLLDGMTARLANAASPFGVELDSLSDVVSFGVAPAYLVYTYGLHDLEPIGMIVAALPALCGAVRLARYNMSYDGERKDYFEGLPIPGQGIALVALILAAEQSAWADTLRLDTASVMIPVVVALSALMVSSIEFDSIPTPTVDYVRAHPQKTALYVLAGVLIVGLQALGLFIVLMVYLAHGVGRAIYQLGKALATPAPIEQGPSDGARAPGEE